MAVENVFGKMTEHCSVTELKQWLSTHRMIANDQCLRISGTKKELIERQDCT